MPRKKDDILKDGVKTRFSKKNQPKPEKKSAGWKKKLLLKDLLNLCLGGKDEKSVTLRETLAPLLGVKPDALKAMTFEEAIDMRQIQRAMNDTHAWKAIKDVVYGSKSAVDVTTQGEKIDVIDYSKLDEQTLRNILAAKTGPNQGKAGTGQKKP